MHMKSYDYHLESQLEFSVHLADKFCLLIPQFFSWGQFQVEGYKCMFLFEELQGIWVFSFHLDSDYAGNVDSKDKFFHKFLWNLSSALPD